ncbi:hypothetical protein PN836_020615 [Ningiella sp. W23]|uniref:hypothetical protein n=1 Tax=Ningiella sp. W23 TaxID=3023715 RepID=UPI0037582789
MIRALLLILCVSIPISASADFSDDFEFSGFARVVAGYYDQDDSVLRSYTNELEFGEDSLIALRGDYSISDSLSIVAQGLLHSSELRDSGLQWLYLDYSPSRSFSLKLGRQRIPFFQYSDVIDVGFAYPQVTLPVAMYSDFLFTEFDGLLGRYNFGTSYFSGYAEAYYGGYEGNINIFSQDISADVTNVGGVVFEARKGKLTLRASHHQGDADVRQESLEGFAQVLKQFGFTKTADSLRINDQASIQQIGFAYEDLDYFVRAEHMIITSDAFLVSKRRASYITAGINHYPFTYHVTAAYGKAVLDDPPNELRFGINPQIDALTAGFNAILDGIPPDQGHQYTIGVRYDIKTNLALKAEVSFIEGSEGTRGFVDIPSPNRTQQSGQLFQIAAEWVF